MDKLGGFKNLVLFYDTFSFRSAHTVFYYFSLIVHFNI